MLCVPVPEAELEELYGYIKRLENEVGAAQVALNLSDFEIRALREALGDKDAEINFLERAACQ